MNNLKSNWLLSRLPLKSDSTERQRQGRTIIELADEVYTLKAALTKYGKHGINCLAGMSSHDRECTCGLSFAKDRAGHDVPPNDFMGPPDQNGKNLKDF